MITKTSHLIFATQTLMSFKSRIDQKQLIGNTKPQRMLERCSGKPSCINGGFQSSLAHVRCPCVWANQKQNDRKLLIYGGDIPYRDTPIEHSFSLILVPSSFLVISCNSIFWNSKNITTFGSSSRIA